MESFAFSDKIKMNILKPFFVPIFCHTMQSFVKWCFKPHFQNSVNHLKKQTLAFTQRYNLEEPSKLKGT